jgi:hypothetical protein
MAPDRRTRSTRREPERRYADRRQAHNFRALVEELLARGEIEIVETIWGREFRRIAAPDETEKAD